MGQPVSPVKTEPTDVSLNCFRKFLTFLARIGIVKPQKSLAVVLSSNAKVQADRFRVTDVQVTVRLWWEPSDDVTPVFAAGNIVADDLANEVFGLIVAHEKSVAGFQTGAIVR